MSYWLNIARTELGRIKNHVATLAGDPLSLKRQSEELTGIVACADAAFQRIDEHCEYFSDKVKLPEFETRGVLLKDFNADALAFAVVFKTAKDRDAFVKLARQAAGS